MCLSSTLIKDYINYKNFINLLYIDGFTGLVLLWALPFRERQGQVLDPTDPSQITLMIIYVVSRHIRFVKIRKRVNFFNV